MRFSLGFVMLAIVVGAVVFYVSGGRGAEEELLVDATDSGIDWPIMGGPALATAAPAVVVTTSSPRPSQRIVVLDPGHGGPNDIGASNYGVVEKESNLDMAFRVERLLREQGVHVALTRRSDNHSLLYPTDRERTGFSYSRADLQARVDLANAEQADLFISIHSNGSPNVGENGVEIWYDPNRPFGEKNIRLANLLQEKIVGELRAYGYPATNRGIKDDTCFRVREDRCFQLFVLGPERETRREDVIRRGGDPEAVGFAPGQDVITTRATQMPGALVELLFISNPTDAAALRDEGARDAMARAIAQAALQFLAER